MSTLSPPQFSRARSSSTLGPITTARSRTVSASPKIPPSVPNCDSIINPTFALPPATPPTPSPLPLAAAVPSVAGTVTRASMLDALIQIASKLIPIHDALSPQSNSPFPTLKEKEKSQSLGLALGSIASTNEKMVRWDDQTMTTSLADAPMAAEQPLHPPSRTRPPPPYSAKPKAKRLRRPLSPFSSLFIAPPSASDTLPQPVSSPRTSGSFSRFNPLSISIPVSDPSSPSTQLHRPPPRLLAPLLTICALFFLTLLPTVVLFYTLPIYSLKSIPRTVADIRGVAKELQLYAASSLSGTMHIFAVLAVLSVWKNAWSVPGSVLLNVLAGALMNPIVATVLQTFLTTIGSLCSTLLSKPLTPVISRIFPKALSLTRSAFETSPASSPELSPVDSEDDEDGQGMLTKKSSGASAPTPIWVRLTILRLIGVVPWSALNLACGICDVPLWDCAIGAFIGVLPWTAVTCQIGDLLQTVASTTSDAPGAPVQTLSAMLSSPSIIAKLVVLSLISLGPVLFRNKLSEMVTRRTRRKSITTTDFSVERDEKSRLA